MKLTKLRVMALGGDAMHKGDIDMYKSLFPETCFMVNMYGATESSSALYYVMNHETELDGEIVPIGYPADNTEIVITKNGVEQRAHSIVGEIGIKSKYTAVGYWNNKELEKSYFTTDRLDPSKRVYMTGDLGRVLENGAIEYVARKDFQIKIRGFRVGLGELESFFTGHDAIKDIIVVANEELGEEKELVAYYVLKPNNENVTPETLRDYLLNKVPDYMIPRFMMEMEALPLTIRGKIDREALPVPEKIVRNTKNINIEKARDVVEEKLVAIWEDILKVSPVGIRENFFSLGGHSLLGFEMFEKVEEIFHVKIEPVALYRGAATVELLANQVRKQLN
jgi:acyl-coenzyme A synthetase/AMP-(fatty) acid ligase